MGYVRINTSSTIGKKSPHCRIPHWIRINQILKIEHHASNFSISLLFLFKSAQKHAPVKESCSEIVKTHHSLLPPSYFCDQAALRLLITSDRPSVVVNVTLAHPTAEGYPSVVSLCAKSRDAV